MKTSEMMAALERDPSQKFEAIGGKWKRIMSVRTSGYFNLATYDDRGEMIDSGKPAGGFNGNIPVSAQWTLVKPIPVPKPVTFMEALKAASRGKLLSFECKSFAEHLHNQKLNEILCYLSENYNSTGLGHILQLGIWYIKEVD